jgi:hypothetical protein
LAAIINQYVIRPANFSHQWREFFVASVGFIKLLHTPNILWRKALNTGIVALYKVRKILNYGFTPAVFGNAAAHVLADVPVHIDEFPINGAESILPRFFDDGDNPIKDACIFNPN